MFSLLAWWFKGACVNECGDAVAGSVSSSSSEVMR